MTVRARALSPSGGRYGVILADCPWKFGIRSRWISARSPDAHYRCMKTADICDLGGRLRLHLAAAPNCFLWLWATWPMLPDALKVMEAWGFIYKSGGAWRKLTRRGKQHRGLGYIFRSATEPYLVGVRGNPQKADSRAARSIINLIEAPVREHSRKPDQQYLDLETMFPGARKLELFARARRPGWDAWGHEAGKFGRVLMPQGRGA